MEKDYIYFQQSLPKYWEIAPIEDIASKISDGSHNPPPKKDFGMPMLSAKNIENNRIVLSEFRYISKEDFEQENKRTNISPGDVLLTIVGTIGRSAVVPQNMEAFTVQRSVAVIKPVGVLPKYLMYQLQSPHLQKHFSNVARGTAQKGVYLKNLRQTPVIVAPTNEQKRIVAEIEKQFSRLDEAVENLQRVKANLKRYKASVLKAAVEGKLTEQWRAEHPDVDPASRLLERILKERRKKWEENELARMKAKGRIPKDDKWKKKYKEPSLPKADELPTIPKAWCWVTSELLAENKDNAICAGPFGTIFKAKDFRTKGIPIIFLRHVSPGKYLTHKPGFMDKKKWEDLFRPYSVFGGELLITKLGEPPGVCAIYPSNIGPAMVTPDVIKMSANEQAVSPLFLMNYFNSKIAIDFASGLAFGTTRLRLTLPIFRNLPVPLPPLNEQHQISAEIDERFSRASYLEQIVEKNLKRADRFRQSILKKAFSGQLVAQDPKDEPATKLLERMKDEIKKQASEGSKQRKKRKKTMGTEKKSKTKRDILLVLKEATRPITPEELFQMSGYKPEEVDQFYADLKKADQENAILQEKKSVGDVYLKVR